MRRPPDRWSRMGGVGPECSFAGVLNCEGYPALISPRGVLWGVKLSGWRAGMASARRPPRTGSPRTYSLSTSLGSQREPSSCYPPPRKHRWMPCGVLVSLPTDRRPTGRGKRGGSLLSPPMRASGWEPWRRRPPPVSTGSGPGSSRSRVSGASERCNTAPVWPVSEQSTPKRSSMPSVPPSSSWNSDMSRTSGCRT